MGLFERDFWLMLFEWVYSSRILIDFVRVGLFELAGLTKTIVEVFRYREVADFVGGLYDFIDVVRDTINTEVIFADGF